VLAQVRLDMLAMLADMSNSVPSTPPDDSLLPHAFLQQAISALKKITAVSSEVNIAEVISKINLVQLVSKIKSSIEEFNSEMKNAVLFDTYK